ncbi:MAG: TetR/AcrR family transcriptional regulator [Desulfobacteraceae bacterium]|nr:TetR/AcrR family transcriptional regulator [Desulfobacteraceae bacterium]
MSPDKAKDEKAKIILDAARAILAQNGYMGTTINLVAKKAGVSRGLLHYYFQNKEDMLATVIKENMLLSIDMIKAVFKNNHTPHGYAKGIVDLLRGVMELDPDFFNLFFEGFAVARQSKVVQDELKSLYAQFRCALETCLDQAKENKVIHPQLSNRALATIITGIVDGMGFQILTEPDLCSDTGIWESMEKAIVDLLCDKQ